MDVSEAPMILTMNNPTKPASDRKKGQLTVRHRHKNAAQALSSWSLRLLTMTYILALLLFVLRP